MKILRFERDHGEGGGVAGEIYNRDINITNVKEGLNTVKK
jgi:hypothetical protein